MKTKTVTLIPFGVKNANGRVYTLESIGKALSDFQTKVNEKRALGELGHPTDVDNFGNILLSRASHFIDRMWVEGDRLIADIRTVETVSGRTLEETLDQYVFRPRSFGTTREDGTVEIMSLVTFDAVLRTEDAWVGIADI